MPRFPKSVRVIGTGITRLGKLSKTANELMREALESALASARLGKYELDGLVAVPSLSHPHLMEAHYLATTSGILPKRNFACRTIDTGGAGPISAILAARSMIEKENCEVVAVVAGDAVSSLPTEEFLARADSGIGDDRLPSPVIPNGYSRITEWHMKTYGVTREQLAKVAVIMSHQGSKHPLAITKRPHTLESVLNAAEIAPSLGLLECARRVDGGGALILASSRFLETRNLLNKGNSGRGDVVVLGGGEGSGPLSPAPIIDESSFSCEFAAHNAFYESQLTSEDIDFFGLYDCFPICFIRAVEAVGLAPKGGGGVDQEYEKILKDPKYICPVNTHGGLLSFGAPWEVPSIFSAIEAVYQLTGSAHGRQIPNARRALVYGNGGIFSASAVAILGKAAIPTHIPHD